MRDREAVEPDGKGGGEELEGVEGRKPWLAYIMRRKKSAFKEKMI